MIYYIYKVRRKQTSIRFSRSVPAHRYLSWISWVRRPQPSTSWVSTRTPPEPQLRARRFRGGAHTQGRDRYALAAIAIWKTSKHPFDLLPRKRKLSFFPFSRVPLVCRSFRVALPTARTCRPRSICGRSAACPSRHLLRPPHKQKMRAHGIAPRTRKKRRLLAQESTRRHAWLTRSCFGRVVFQQRRPAFTTALFPFSFFTRKRKKKTEANSAGSNTSLGLTSFVLTMYAIGPPRLVR